MNEQATSGGSKGDGMNIHQKLHAIKKNLVVQKTGYDDNNEYYYFKADDVARDVHAAMAEYGVIHRTTFGFDELNIDNHWDKNGRNRPRLTALVTVEFICVDGSGTFQTQVVATGSDIGGDKAARKLHVQAFKIAAIDLFGVTEGMQSMDSDGYKQDEPDIASDSDAGGEAKPDSQALGKMITELIEDPALEHIDGDMVLRLGRIVAADVLGKLPSDRVWRKDARVLESLVKRLSAGEVAPDDVASGN